ncbi:MAG: hypothetical protein FJ125_14320, partial [Deltaproteobacteria bacterium]|nr:hypothetical protein [Deltaproteobacteria bacterium]
MDIHPVAPATLATATAAVTATTSAGTPTRVILLAGLLLAGCRTDGTVPGPPASTAAPPPVAASTAGATTPVAGPGTAAPLGAATELVDDSGRTVRLPAVIRRVYPAGPPAMVLVYVVARDALVGWPQELPAGAEAFIPAPYWQLPRL